MKKTLLALAVLGAVSSVANAQSNVTVYGLIDTALRYTTDVPKSTGGTGDQLSLGNGALKGSRLGFKGEEDLGGGTSAVFDLEAGFASTTGALGQQGQLFGRQEFIGLKNKSWGEIDAGRQYGVAADLLGINYDPLAIGNANENSWEYYLYGYRFDNTLKYTNNFGPVKLEVQYSPGGQAGSSSVGSTDGFSLQYTEGPLSIGGVYERTEDQNSNELDVAGIGGYYIAGPAKIFLQYFDAKRDPGFAKAANLSGGALANTSLLGNGKNLLQRKDGVWTTGVIYTPADPWSFTLGYMHDSVTNDSSLGDSGKVTTAYAVADYHFSKRTDVYLEFDHTTIGGGEIGDTNTVMAAAGTSFGGNTVRNATSLGLRVYF